MPVIVTADFAPTIGGIQRYVASIADEFTTLGHRVVVVAPGVVDAADATRTYEVARYAAAHRVSALWSMDRAIAAARARVEDDVVIASSWNPAGLAAARGRYVSRGTLAIIAFGSEISRQNTPMRRFAMQSVFHAADVIVSISRYTSECLRSAGVERDPVLAGCGIDRGFFRPEPGLVPIILSVGRLVRRKGFDSVIKALPVLRSRFPGLRYEIVGDGPDRTYLAELAQCLGVEREVVFHGQATDAETRAAYERAWCFALPVRREGTDVEGFGLVYLEAAMAWLAAIGGRGSGAEDAIEDGVTGLLVDGTCAAEIVHALDVLLRDRDFAARLSVAAYQRAVRDFSWTRVTATIARSVGLA